MQVKVKRLSEKAVLPSYAKPGDAGMDLMAVTFDVTEKYVEYDTQLAFEIPEGYVGLLFPRSSVSKLDLILANCVGVVDSTYRGSVKLRFKHTEEYILCDMYKSMDRVGQIIIMPYPQIELLEVDELNDSIRGDGGFGHTGN